MKLRIILYDIENDSYRLKLAKMLEAMGFVRLQKSVFAGMHTQNQWQKLWKQVRAMHKSNGEDGDKIYSVILSKEMFRSMKHMGIPPPFKVILEEEITLWV